MAEGGEDDPENPFSFSKFIKKKEKNTLLHERENENTVIDDIFDLPDHSVAQRKEKTLVVADEEEPEESLTYKKKHGADNPFSFKRFLANPKSTAGKNKNIAPDFASDLPDFVQDHFSGDSQTRKHHVRNDNDNQDFLIPDLSGRLSPRPELESVFTAGAVQLETNNCLDNSFNSDNESDSLNDPGPQLPSRLPDFLSDGVISSSGILNDNSSNSLYSTRSLSTVEVSGDIELELRRLRKENDELRTQLVEAKQVAQSESKRVSELTKQMEKQRQKEMDETSVLERAVMQVEENLVTTTKRAVKAETAVNKLKQEVKILQQQVTALQEENQLLVSGDRGLSEIRERTKYASAQLAAAAKTGDQQIKQLQNGIENLRLLSQVLASVDKIKDYVPLNSEQQGDT